MATAKKKTTVKKTTAKKPRATAAKTTTRKAPVKKMTSTSATRQKSTFLTMTPTIETIYWLILGVVVILLAIWVLTLTAKINDIYNQIDVQNASNAVVEPSHSMKHHK